MLASRNRSGPRPPRSASVIAVGQRVFINCPGDRAGSVPLEDVSGKVHLPIRLADGAAVEVVAWRPRGTSDPRYRVRRASDGADGWVDADSLRRTLDPVETPPAPAAPVSAPPSISDPGARPFGQRSHRGFDAGLASVPTGSVAPLSPSSDDGGKRFGRR